MLDAPRDELVETIRNTARFGEAYALSKYDAICAAAKDAAVFGRALPSNALRIRLYIKTYREYQAHLDSILEELHKAVDNLQGDPVYDRICLLQSLRGVGFLSAVVLIAEMGSFDLPWGQGPHVQARLQPCAAYPAYDRHKQPESG